VDAGKNNDESGPLTFLLVLADGVRGHKLALINDDRACITIRRLVNRTPWANLLT